MTATVHDLIPLLQQRGRFGPDQTSFLARWLVRRSVAGLRNCSSLIADSSNTRKDIEEAVQTAGKPVSVVPIALDRLYRTAAENEHSAGRSAAAIGRPVILHVGHNGHYKNRAGVLRVFAKVREALDCRLLLVGPPPSGLMLNLMQELGLEDHIEFVGEVDDRALLELYRRSALFLFPSLYEGFGWPPLEAMACGCPVVCSTEGALDEVVGDAALKASARDEDELARLCLAVLQDDRLAESFRIRGKRHASQFTSSRMGAQLLAVYQQALGFSTSSLSEQPSPAPVGRN